METLQFDLSKEVLSFKTLPLPKITTEDEIIIEVAYAGLCGTDLHIIQGEFPCSKKPFILGHEFSGVVKETGPAVIHVKPGDRVALDPQCWCTTCKNCTSANYHLCTEGGVDNATGINCDGGFAKFAKGRARQVYKLPSSLSLKQGVLSEPISCVVRGLDRCISTTPVGADILISGAGIIGNLWSAILHHLGHRKVTVVEPSKDRRIINKNIGLGFECVSPDELKSKLDNGQLFDLAIDCSGNGGALQQAFGALRSPGTLCVFGVSPPDTRIMISPFEIYKKELTIVGCNINPFSMSRALGLMEAMGEKYICYEKLGARVYQLKEYNEAISALRTGAIAKVIFQINPNLE